MECLFNLELRIHSIKMKVTFEEISVNFSQYLHSNSTSESDLLFRVTMSVALSKINSTQIFCTFIFACTCHNVNRETRVFDLQSEINADIIGESWGGWVGGRGGDGGRRKSGRKDVRSPSLSIFFQFPSVFGKKWPP